MASSPKIVAIGEAMVEFAPVDGGLYRQGFAGDTFNTASHIAGLLGPRVEMGYVSSVGTDAVSDRFVAQARDTGIGIEGIWRDPDRTMGLYVISLKRGERSFQYWRTTSAARHLADDGPRLTNAMSGADVIYLSGITLAILAEDARGQLFRALAEARAKGARIAFDPNYRPTLWETPEAARDAFMPMLAMTDIALPSFDDEHLLWGDATPAATIERLSRLSVSEIAVKDGPGPVFARHEGETCQFETPAVDVLRDTTGAGDAFNAGFLAGIVLAASHSASIAAGQMMAREVLAHFGALVPAERMLKLKTSLAF